MKKRQNRMPIKKMAEEISLDSIERWGNDVETAVELALEELKTTREDVDIEVLEEPSKGFFGIGAKLAKVKVTKKNANAEEKKVQKKKEKRGPIRKEELTEEELESIKSTKASSKTDRKGGKRERSEKRNQRETGDYESRIPEEPIMPIVDKETLEILPDDNEGLRFLKRLVEAMGQDINLEGRTDGKDLFFFIDGKDSGTIIGKRGATLDAIQYLTSLVVNKEEGDYIRVVVDAENYRAKREKALEKLAIRLADKVSRSGRSYKLEPMNPYERKVIHATLQQDSRIVTRSEGQDPARRVIIELKK